MTPLRLFPRVLRVLTVLVRYRLDDLVDEAHVMRPLQWARAVLPKPRAQIAAMQSAASTPFIPAASADRSVGAPATIAAAPPGSAPGVLRRPARVALRSGPIPVQPGCGMNSGNIICRSFKY